MATAITELQKLSLNVYDGVAVQFENVSGEDAIKNAILKSVGGKWDFYSFQQNKWGFYQMLSEILTLPLAKTMEGMFDGIVDTETIALGDRKVYEIESPELFKVATVSAGNSDIRRQKLFNNQIVIETGDTEIKIYEDFDKFLAGRINWVTLIDRVRKSVSNDTATKIYKALIGSYSDTNTNYNKSGTFSETILDEMISRVEAKTGMKCAIYGTKVALGKVSTGIVSIVTTVGASITAKEDMYAMGYFRNYKQTPMIEVPTILTPGTEVFAFGADLFILPIGEKILKVVFEGAPIIQDLQDSTRRNDRQIEFLFSQKIGVACLIAGYFGIYKLQ